MTSSMKKGIAGAMFAATLLGGSMIEPKQAEARDDVTALLLSFTFPGAGEWYNSGYSGGFPLVECILGAICPCVHIASLFDATAGRSDDGIRFDFWASPNR